MSTYLSVCVSAGSHVNAVRNLVAVINPKARLPPVGETTVESDSKTQMIDECVRVINGSRRCPFTSLHFCFYDVTFLIDAHSLRF